MEFEIINKYFLPLTNKSKASGALKDDAALVLVSLGKELVISKDLMIEDVHFSKSDGAYNIACKLLKSNLSDLAASGAKPKYYMLGFSQKNPDEEFIKEFCRGLKDVGDEFKIDLIGGDSVRVPNKLCFSITIFGEVPKGKSLVRKNAKAQDLIFVSGDIGDAFLGLKLLQEKISCDDKTNYQYLINRHLQPTPRIKLGMELVKQNIKSAIDVSDGFLADLKHICETSKLDAIINQDDIPISKSAKSALLENNIDSSELLSGGEDYELIFTAKKSNEKKIEDLAKKLGLKITKVGYLQKAKSTPKIELLDKDGKNVKILKYGWQHYDD
jgi:thiamine-monophosphate kinase